MDRIAVISDIHGNIPAFDAVLQDISIREIDLIYCLGDIVGKGPQPIEAVEMVKRYCDKTVRGNWDENMAKDLPYPSFQWNRKILSDKDIHWLASLPFSIELRMSGRNIRLFHASPTSVHHRVQPWDEFEKRQGLFKNTEATGAFPNQAEPDVVGYGDIHNAFIQHFQGKTLFNTGALGNPLEINQASYAIMEGFIDSDELLPFSVQFVRVPYNYEETIRIAQEIGMPETDALAAELRFARYRGLKKD